MKNGLIYREEGVLYVVYPGQISWVMDDIFRYYCSIVWFKQRRIILDSVVITNMKVVRGTNDLLPKPC